MKDPVQTGRRRFLGGSLGLVVALLAGHRPPAAAEPEVARRVRASFTDPDAAVVLGKAYLAARREPAGVGCLATELTACDPIWEAALRSGSAADLRRLAAEQCRIDFTAGRLVAVDGWVLGLTEVRLCGLAALA
jgi:hypothetical protein